MRTVRDSDGETYVLLKESAESSLVADPETGETRHVPNDELESVAGESPLTTAASAVDSSVRTLLTAVHDERALGLLVTLEDRGPTAVRTLLDGLDICESDVHGIATELRAAGLLAEAEVAGRRGYRTTDEASEALAALTDRSDSDGGEES